MVFEAKKDYRCNINEGEHKRDDWWIALYSQKGEQCADDNGGNWKGKKGSMKNMTALINTDQ